MNKIRNVTFIGLGTMGYPMAGHLSKSSLINLRVFNRTIEKALKWNEEFEGEVITSLEQAVSDADVVITCTGRDEDMMEIVFADDGFYPFLKEGAIFIDHTTTSFKLAKHLNESLQEKSVEFIDAPVSGGEAGAVKGILSVMAGGDQAVLEASESLIRTYSKNITYMGQSLLDPPSVEGWYTGQEWINSGSLLARINFVADRVANTSLPGIQTIIDRIKGDGVSTPEELVEASLEHMGFLEVGEETMSQLLDHAKGEGAMNWSDEAASGTRVGEMLALVGATTEYQFG